MTYDPNLRAKYWLDRKGKLRSVRIDASHEEWADSQGFTLESLLDKGWIRIQYCPPIYVFIDNKQPASHAQIDTLKAIIDVAGCKIVIECDGKLLIETSIPAEALKHVVSE